MSGQGDAFEVMAEEFGIPILLHPADAAASESRRAGIEFSDPLQSSVLAGVGLEVFHFPGHTGGSIVLYSGNHGGLLLAGHKRRGRRRAQGEVAHVRQAAAQRVSAARDDLRRPG